MFQNKATHRKAKAMRSSNVKEGGITVSLEYDVTCTYCKLRKHVVRLAKEALKYEKRRKN